MRRVTRLTTALTALVSFSALFTVCAVMPAIAQTTVTPTVQPGSTTYVVQPGDDLYRIGLKFGLTVTALAQANGIVNSNFVFVGQTLTIPAGANPANGQPSAQTNGTPGTPGTQAASTPGTPGVPTIIPLATTEPSATPNATATLINSTLDAGILGTPTPVGQLPVPTVITSTQAAAAPGTTTSTTTNAAGTYTVQSGDNLYRISLKFNTNMLALMQLNNIPNPNLIYVGEVLHLPNGSQSTANATGTAPANAASNVGFAFGLTVNMTGQDANALTASAKDLGMAWVKVPVSWRTMEITKGNIDPSALDNEVNILNGNGLNILLNISSAPDWARDTSAESGPPKDFNDYANFVGALAGRYKGKVQAYEIWSQPNIRREWNGQPLSAASYVEMLRLAWTAIKKADPAALVVSAGLAPTGYNDGVNAISDRLYLRQAFSAGLASYADAIGVHPSGWANPPDSTCCTASAGVTGWFNDRSFYFLDTLKDYRDIMTQANAGGTFMWITEMGWGSSDGVVSDPTTVDKNFAYVTLISQAQQAQYVTRAFEIARTLGYVGPTFLYNLNYCQTVNTQSTGSDFAPCYYSLLNTSGQQRPVYMAVKNAQK